VTSLGFVREGVFGRSTQEVAPRENRSPLHSGVLVIAAMISLASAGATKVAGGSSRPPYEVHGRKCAPRAAKCDYSVDLNRPGPVVGLRKLALRPLASDS
jgi:hypothetical protein